MNEDNIPAQHKRCTACQLIKPYEEFGKESKGKDGLKSRCRTCISQKNKAYAAGAGAEVKKNNNQMYRDSHGATLREKQRLARLKKKFGDRYQEYLIHEEIRKNLKNDL